MASSVSVTLDIALTTTNGRSPSRALTIPAIRSIAVESSTDVPPNFMTITASPPPMIEQVRRSSPQVALHFEEFGIQEGCAGRAADGVVREHSELVVEHAARPQPPHTYRHAIAAVKIEAWLRTVGRRVIHQRPFGRQRTSQLMRLGAKLGERRDDFISRTRRLQLHRHRLRVPVLHRDTIAVGGHAEAGILDTMAVQLAEELSRLLFHLLFFVLDERNHIAENVERRYTGISCTAHRLHGGNEQRLHAELFV